MRTALVVAVVVCIWLVSADEDVRILQPVTLAKKFPNGVPERPALFGIPSYASSITGDIVYATPGDLDGCSPINKKLGRWPAAGQVVILMVDRGNCSFVQKVKNCEAAGAHAAIIVDNADEPGLPYMADDGTGRGVGIPSVIIHKKDGDTIKMTLATQTVVVVMTWSIVRKDDRVEWDFWTSANDDQSKVFKTTFGPASDALGTHALFTPHYFVISGDSAGCRGADKPCGTQCTNAGRYCSVDPDHELDKGLSGAHIVTENLRQMCLFAYLNRTSQASSKWWTYVNRFDKECAGSTDTWTVDCSGKILLEIGIPPKEVSACVAASGGSDPDTDVPNTLLEADMSIRMDRGIFYLPSIAINDVPFFGGLECPLPIDIQHCGVLSAICAGYVVGTEPDACKSVRPCDVGVLKDVCGVCGGSTKKSEDCESGKSFPVYGIVLIALSCVAVVSVGVYCFMKRQQNIMRDDIDSLLKRYLPLDDANASAANASAEHGASDE